MVTGVAKSLGLHIDYVLYDMSYANLNLYSASLPTYRKPDKKETPGKDKKYVINADDPNNRDLIRQIIDAS